MQFQAPVCIFICLIFLLNFSFSLSTWETQPGKSALHLGLGLSLDCSDLQSVLPQNLIKLLASCILAAPVLWFCCTWVRKVNRLSTILCKMLVSMKSLPDICCNHSPQSNDANFIKHSCRTNGQHQMLRTLCSYLSQPLNYLLAHIFLSWVVCILKMLTLVVEG